MRYHLIMFSISASIAQFNRQNVLIWLSMAFQAGVINAGGFLACHRFVTHTTGFATFFGSEFSQGHFRAALGMLSAPLFFLAGSVTSGYFVDRRLALNEPPRYDGMFGFIGFTLILISIAGEAGSFGSFGAPLNLSTDFIFLALLCLCSGIQNGTLTSASGAVIRTTHLTGITTDLGIGLVRVLTSGRSPGAKSHESRANWMRIGLIFSFVCGSTAGAFLYYQWHYLAFLLPAFISLLLTALLVWKRRQHASERSHARAS